jgi:4-amino-4-deoxy-L-arabinose transferase-like glycosyltransferase
VNHRGPVFPAILALDFKVAGYSLDHALWVSRLFALGSAALLLALGWRLFGREAGLLAAAFALASALLTLLGASLFLDGAQTFFLLLTLLLVHVALRDGGAHWAALAGGAFGLAVLTKESALLWLPLPCLAVLLLGPAVDRPGRLLVAYGLGLLAVAGWWWPYVYAVTGRVYLLGAPSSAAGWPAAGGAAMALLSLASVKFAQRPEASRLDMRARWGVALALLAAWGALFVAGLERHSLWPYPADYLTSVPDYTSTVLASWVQPLPLIGLAWCYVAYRALRGSLGDRLLLLGLLLFLPFALFVANRNLHVRDMLPLVYLSYLALGRGAVDGARWLAELSSEAMPRVAGVVAAMVMIAAFGWFAVAQAERFAAERDDFHAGVVSQQHWDNALARDTAAWISDHVPPGTPVMSTRLYYSHLYTLTGARYPWWQLPTVRVDFEGDPPAPVRRSTLFRWEDHRLPDGPGGPWLYLQRYPAKGYYIALSEQDLIDEIAEHDIGYFVLTGDDAGFSSLSLRAYFDNHPYFEKVKSFVVDDANQAHIYRVLPAFDEPVAPPALVDSATVEALYEELGADRAEALLDGLSPGGYTTSAAYAVSEGPEAE